MRDTLLKSHELREICDDSPLVTVAIHRLLLSILYRAFNGPRNFRTWKELYRNGGFDQSSVTAYLNKHKNRFNLVDSHYPFFQMAKLEMKKPVSVTRLATECASGNNATLFDHTVDEEEVACSAAQAARWLVGCQSFALGFGKSGNATINGQKEALPYSADAIALRGMNIWLQGATAFDTLMINLTPTNDKSSPPWELNDSHMYRDKLNGEAHSCCGIVDRFTWQSRLVRLLPRDEVFSRMYFTQGRSADKSPGDPMKVYRKSKEKGISALPLSSGKAAWRDAHSILTIPPGNSNEQRPECFNLLARAHSDGVIPLGINFVTQVVGLASAPNKAGKFLLWRHERMPVSVEILNDVNLIERLGRLLQHAENAASEQYERTKRVCRFFRIPDGHEPSKKEWEDINKLVEFIDPRPAYWACMEKHFFALLEYLPEDWDNTNEEWKPDAEQIATNTWRKQVKKEAKQALEESTRSLGTTTRAIQAIARVRTDFNDDDLKPNPQHRQKKKKGGKKK